MMPFTHGEWTKFAIYQVEKPAVFIGEKIAKLFPLVTHENVYKPNSHAVLFWRDNFFGRRKMNSRYNALFGLISFLASKIDRDDYYGDIFKDFIKYIREYPEPDIDFRPSNNYVDQMEEY